MSTSTSASAGTSGSTSGEMGTSTGDQLAPYCADMVAWWRAEGDATDATGNNHDGVALNGTLYGPGQVGQTFEFDGVASSVDVSDDPAFELTSAISVEAWVRIDEYPGNIAQILFRGDDNGGLDPYYLSVMWTGTVRWHVEASDLSAGNLEAPIDLGTWTHIVGTFDAMAGQMEIWRDGVLVATMVTGVMPIGALDPTQDPGIGIGNHHGDAHNQPLNGAVDEVTLYSTALTPAEIAELYALGAAGSPKCQ